MKVSVKEFKKEYKKINIDNIEVFNWLYVVCLLLACLVYRTSELWGLEGRLSEQFCALLSMTVVRTQVSSSYSWQWSFGCLVYVSFSLYFCIFCIFCVGFCFLSTRQEIGWEEHLKWLILCQVGHIILSLSINLVIQWTS